VNDDFDDLPELPEEEEERPSRAARPPRRRPAVAEKASLEAVLGEELPAELFTIVPWGHRIVVVREKPIETTQGGIIIPKPAQRQLDTGWVVSIGDRVGEIDAHSSVYAGVCPISPPEALLGMKVTFAKFGGQALFPRGDSVGGTGYESRFVLLSDGDIYYHHIEKE
jgi:co-chaperonin GroES (HSP10)